MRDVFEQFHLGVVPNVDWTVLFGGRGFHGGFCRIVR